jgi:hypothetical protein
MTEVEHQYLWNRRHQLMVRVLANRMYQQERQRRFEFREGLVKATSVIAGTVAFANVTNQNPLIIKWCLFFITAFNIFALVYGYGNKARDSGKRASDWALLERDIELAGERDFTETQIGQWVARCNEIEAGEPASHQLLMELCSKRANVALGGEYDLQLTRFQKLFPIVFIP